MDELFAELKECTCIVQGREATAQQIIEKHVTRLFLSGGAQIAPEPVADPAPIDTVEPTPHVVIPEPRQFVPGE